MTAHRPGRHQLARRKTPASEYDAFAGWIRRAPEGAEHLVRTAEFGLPPVKGPLGAQVIGAPTEG